MDDHITYTIREDKPTAEMRFLIYNNLGLVPVVACRTLLTAEAVRDFLAGRRPGDEPASGEVKP